MKLNENFDQLIKKEKRKRLLKTIAISFVTTVVLLFIGYTLTVSYTLLTLPPIRRF